MTVLEFIKSLPNSSPRTGFESRIKVLVSSEGRMIGFGPYDCIEDTGLKDFFDYNVKGTETRHGVFEDGDGKEVGCDVIEIFVEETVWTKWQS